MQLPDFQRVILAAKLYSYLNSHADSTRVLSEGIERNPDVPHLYRHRGHFLISQRKYAESLPDFEKAVQLLDSYGDDEIEYYQAELVPEMIRILLDEPAQLLTEPTPINDSTLAELKDVYKGTLKSSTWYHYGLAHYLLGNFDEAARIYEKSLEYAIDDDMKVATLDWLYMSLQRAGQTDRARELLDSIDTDMHINEPSYHRRMQLYKGQLAPEQLLGADEDRRTVATQGYGVGNWYLYNGDVDNALKTFGRVLELGQFPAFGYLAAEADLKRHGS